MELPDRIQVCPTCGNENRASQTSWKTCCLLDFDFGGGVIGLDAGTFFPPQHEPFLARFGQIEVRLYLRRYTTDENGVHYLTAGCVSLPELDCEIAELRRDLRQLRQQAKRLLARRPAQEQG